MAISYKIIGRHIRAARKSHQLTQEQVAEKLKMSVAHYGRLERGEREINLDRLAQISLILAIPLERMVEGCTPEVNAIISENTSEDIFSLTMKTYAQRCSPEVLRRMLRVCEVLAAEDEE